MSSQPHQSDTRILDRRTLRQDHRALVALLAQGMSVLDVGCGTGAITRDIARAVGADGQVIGLDRDRGLIERANGQASAPNLRFAVGDATTLEADERFDVVTAARTLQWIADPREAILRMARALKPGGRLVVLDYNHALNTWDPAPPREFAEFYSRFLSWRAAQGWDNEMGNRCKALFDAAGLDDVRCESQDETTVRGADDFDQRTELWSQVIVNLGPTLEEAGVADASLLASARRTYGAWRTTTLERHFLSMTVTTGIATACPKADGANRS
jgi:SAM-dependent methyltransferase